MFPKDIYSTEVDWWRGIHIQRGRECKKSGLLERTIQDCKL
jgi:hypothetical protein